jgi:hypothetical protein
LRVFESDRRCDDAPEDFVVSSFVWGHQPVNPLEQEFDSYFAHFLILV